METRNNPRETMQVPVLDLQKKYNGRAFNMVVNNTGDQPVRVRLFGNGQTFAEVVDEQEQGGETENYVKTLTELPASMNYDDVFVWTGDGGDNGMVPGAMYVNRGTGEVVPIPSDVIFVWNGKSVQSYWPEEEAQEFLSQLYGRIIFEPKTGVFYEVKKYEWEEGEGEIFSRYETIPIPANNQVVSVGSLGELVSSRFRDGQIIHYAFHIVVDNENLKPGYNLPYRELLMRNIGGLDYEIVGCAGDAIRGMFSAKGKEGICDGANCVIGSNEGGYEWSLKLRIPFKDYDTEYDGVSYLCFGTAEDLHPSYYIPENVVLGDEVTIYRYSDVLDGLDPERPLVCTVTGDKSTWGFEGCITRLVDLQRNLSFPFDFANLMMKINGSWVWMFGSTDGSHGNGLSHARNVVYEGDDMPSGLFFRSIRDLTGHNYEEVLWSNIRIGYSVANVKVTGDYVKNIVIDDGVANITIESGIAGDADNWLQNIHVLSGDYEDNDQPSVVTIDRARNYKTTVGLTSLGQVATKNLMD